MEGERPKEKLGADGIITKNDTNAAVSLEVMEPRIKKKIAEITNEDIIPKILLDGSM